MKRAAWSGGLPAVCWFRQPSGWDGDASSSGRRPVYYTRSDLHTCTHAASQWLISHAVILKLQSSPHWLSLWGNTLIYILTSFLRICLFCNDIIRPMIAHSWIDTCVPTHGHASAWASTNVCVSRVCVLIQSDAACVREQEKKKKNPDDW